MVEINYSLLNRFAEDELLPWCRQNDMGVLIRGPMRKGILAGKYDADTVFTDSVRRRWNKGESHREQYEQELQKLQKVRAALLEGEDLPTTAIRYVISHQAEPVAIPGATSVRQVESNAAAGAELLSPDRLEALKV